MCARVRWHESQRFARFDFTLRIAIEKVEHRSEICTRFHMRRRKLNHAPIRRLCIGNTTRRLQRARVAIPHQCRIRIECRCAFERRDCFARLPCGNECVAEVQLNASGVRHITGERLEQRNCASRVSRFKTEHAQRVAHAFVTRVERQRAIEQSHRT